MLSPSCHFPQHRKHSLLSLQKQRALAPTLEVHHEKENKHVVRKRKKRGEEENKMQLNCKKAKLLFALYFHTMFTH